MRLSTESTGRCSVCAAREHYFLTVEPKKVSRVSKKDTLRSAWPAFWGDHLIPRVKPGNITCYQETINKKNNNNKIIITKDYLACVVSSVTQAKDYSETNVFLNKCELCAWSEKTHGFLGCTKLDVAIEFSILWSLFTIKFYNQGIERLYN